MAAIAAEGRQDLQDNARVAGALLRLLLPSPPIHSIRSLAQDLASDACAILILSCMANIDSPGKRPPCCDRIALGILSALSTMHCEKINISSAFNSLYNVYYSILAELIHSIEYKAEILDQLCNLGVFSFSAHIVSPFWGGSRCHARAYRNTRTTTMAACST